MMWCALFNLVFQSVLPSLFWIVNLQVFFFRVSDAGLSAIAENCPLHKLNLCGCQLITDSGLTAIARGCPDLVFLDISVLRVCISIWCCIPYLKTVQNLSKQKNPHCFTLLWVHFPSCNRINIFVFWVRKLPPFCLKEEHLKHISQH